MTAYADTCTPVFLPSVFAKGDRIDLSAAERNQLAGIIDRIIEAYRDEPTGRQP